MSHSTRRKSNVEGPALQVICLGAGGGPSEDNVTGFLVRSMAIGWQQRNSVLAVDAGSHLAAITQILARDFPMFAGPRPRTNSTSSMPSPGGDALSDNEDLNTPSDRSTSPEPTILSSGPFQGAHFPCRSARANAVHFVREHVDAYLITHPHLDHLSGFAINTAAFHNTSKPKKLSALPFVVTAIKQHIFNDIIWPNLTDEEDGVGFVTFQRLTEGGNHALGEGSSRGFIEVCNGLAVKGFKISHGTCASKPRGSAPSERRGSRDMTAQQMQSAQGPHTPHHHPHHGLSRTSTLNHAGQAPNSLKVQDGATPQDNGRRSSIFSQQSQPGTPTVYGSGADPFNPQSCVVDSTAFFIRADQSGREILIFGDVEPDSLSSNPRTHIVWAEAAPKIAAGLISGIFIECSYTDSQPDRILFGHLAPRHLIAELQTLADMVVERKREQLEKASKKRKRHSHHHSSGAGTTSEHHPHHRSRHHDGLRHTPTSPLSLKQEHSNNNNSNTSSFPLPMFDGPTPMQTDSEDANLNPPALQLDHLAPSVPDSPPLKGVRIIVIHVKDTMMDGPPVGESILEELQAHEGRLKAQGRPLGCTFEVSRSGDSYFF